MVRQANTRPYSREAMTHQPTMMETLVDFDDGASSGILENETGSYGPDYHHPSNPDWVDPQIAIREEAARVTECDAMGASVQFYEQVQALPGGGEAGQSVVPGKAAPNTGYCEPPEK